MQENSQKFAKSAKFGNCGGIGGCYPCVCRRSWPMMNCRLAVLCLARKSQGNVGNRLRVVYVSFTCRLRVVYVSFTCLARYKKYKTCKIRLLTSRIDIHHCVIVNIVAYIRCEAQHIQDIAQRGTTQVAGETLMLEFIAGDNH